MENSEIPAIAARPPFVEEDRAEIPSPERPHWSSAVGILVWAASVAAILILPSIFVAVYAAASGAAFTTNDELVAFATRDPGAIVAQISAIFPAHIITLALAWAVVTRMGRFPFFASLGWGSGGIRWYHYIGMLVLFLLVTAAATSIFPIKEDDMERIVRSSRTALYLIAAMAVFTAPLVEEVVYRGIVYAPMRQKFGVASAVIVVTVLFTAVHVPQYYENPAKIGLLTLLSLGLTLLRAYSGNLLPCFILHLLVNAINAALLIAEPYIRPVALDPAVQALLK